MTTQAKPQAVRPRARWEDLTSTEWSVIRALVKFGTPKAAASQPKSVWVARTASSNLQNIHEKLYVRGYPNVVGLYREEGASRDSGRKQA